MDSNAMVMLKFGGLTAVARLEQFSSFESLVDFTCTRWMSLKRGNISMTYVIDSNSFCMLDNENDFICMRMMVACRRIDFVEINVNGYGISGRNETLGESSTSVGLICNSSGDAEHSSNSLNDDPINFFRHKDSKLKSADWAYAIERVGQVFEGGCPEFRNALCKFATEVGFDFEYLKNDRLRVTTQCTHKVDKACPWRIHASIEKVNGYLYIRKYVPNHTCQDVVSTDFGHRMNAKVLGNVLVEKVKSNPAVRACDLVKDLHKEYGLVMKYKAVWRGLEKAKETVFGDSALAYDQLRHYFAKIKQLDPNFQYALDYDPVTFRFNRCFIGFGACLRGFTFCRPRLFLDGTFLNGKYRGTLLAATAKDGDNGLFHVAFAIVGSEDIANWSWFLENLRSHLGGREITFISDRHPGIIASVKKIMPTAHHSFCLYHIRNNFRDKLRAISVEMRSNLIYKLSKLAYAPTRELFQSINDEMRAEGGSKVHEFLDNLPVGNFATAYFQGRRYGEMCSNAAESFNSQIKDAKSLPVLELIDQIRLKVMERMSKRRQESNNWKSTLCPSLDKKYHEAITEGKSWTVHSSNENEFEVHSEPSMAVNIRQRTCTCGKWQHKGFPCVHAVAVLYRKKNDSSSYIEEYFHTSYYKKSYAMSIPAIPSFGQPIVAEDPVILPPQAKRQPGRPRKNRIPSRGEVLRRKMMCSRCKKYGNHNKSTCKEPLLLE